MDLETFSTFGGSRQMATKLSFGYVAMKSEQESHLAEDNTLNPVELATELTIAWLANQNNRVAAEDVPAFLRNMHETVTQLASGTSASPAGEQAPAEEFTPAVSVRKSLASKDHIISMIDGKPYRTLKRHLATNGLSPEEYRRRYNLKSDYPMVAESYSAARREMARSIGLGASGRQARAGESRQGAPQAEAGAKPEGAAKPKRAPRAAKTD
jgi:predicted transcriptional regulator